MALPRRCLRLRIAGQEQVEAGRDVALRGLAPVCTVVLLVWLVFGTG